MKKRRARAGMSLVLLLLFLAFALSCGEKKEGKDAVERLSTSDRTPEEVDSIDPSGQRIVFWYQHTRAREKALKALIEEFNDTNPHDIHISGEYAGSYQDIYRKMMAAIQSGALPNLVVAYQNQSSSYYLGGAVADLEPFLISKKWGCTREEVEDFFQNVLSQDLYRGKRMGFPPNRSMEVLYYNADWLRELGCKEPPVTWEQFREIAVKARSQPFSLATHSKRSIAYQIDVNASRIASMVFSRSGKLMNEDHTRYTLNTPQMKQTLTFLKDLVGDGLAEIVPERYGDRADFGAGNLLFAIGSTSGMPFFEEAIEAGEKFEWDIAVLPHSSGAPVQNIYGASISVLRSTQEKELASWLFLKWFTDREQQVRWARASSYFPVRKSAASELGDYFEANPKYGKAFDLLCYGTSEPPVPGYDLVRDRLEKAVIEVIRGGDVDKILHNLEEKAQKTLTQSGPEGSGHPELFSSGAIHGDLNE